MNTCHRILMLASLSVLLGSFPAAADFTQNITAHTSINPRIIPARPALPALPALNGQPALPALPAIPEINLDADELPALPAIPAIPAINGRPAQPALPALPAIKRSALLGE